MKTFGKLAAAFGLFTMLAATDPARSDRGGPDVDSLGGGSGLLSNKGVQKELKLSENQVKTIDALFEDNGSKNRAEGRKLLALPKDDARAKMIAQRVASNRELSKKLAEVVTPDQVKRLQQIQIQREGHAAFDTPRVRDAIHLTDDQITKVREIVQETGQKIRDAVTNSGDDDFQAAMKRVADMRKAAFDRVTALLTDDQKSAYRVLTGTPYEVRFERR